MMGGQPGGRGGAGGGGAGGGAGGGTGGFGGQNPFPSPSPGPNMCPDMCPEPLKREMICASDRKNYRSMCLMQQYACQTGERLSVMHRGLCSGSCGPECYMVYEPVCGTDGLTYMSRCDLDRTACLAQDPTLQVAYNQECAGVSALKGCLECDPIPSPVCSTNGMTFRSECEFDRFVCIFDVKNIEVAANGSCPGAPLSPIPVCPNYCEAINDPVCASDGNTYPNVCEVGIADCKAKSKDIKAQVSFESFGGCPETTPDPCSPNAPECQLLMEPVCARKGRNQMVTFYNMCFFEKEVCFDPQLKFVRTGVCNARNQNGRRAPARIMLPRRS